MKCLRVLQLVIIGREINEAIREVSQEFPADKAGKRIKRVSFKEGPHVVQEISDDGECEGDDGEEGGVGEINEIVNYHLNLPEDDDEEGVREGKDEEGEFKVETNFSWNDEDGDFVF